RSDVVGDVVGAVSLLAGLGVAGMAVRAIAMPGDSKDLNMWIGTALHVPSKYPTFEYYVGAIGHALAPWSAFLPFAFGRLFLAAPGRTGPAGERESLARTAVLVGATVALIAHGYLVARTDLVAFSGPALCAVAIAVSIRDFERGAHASIAVGLGTLLLAAVIHHDFHELPEKAYMAFGITGATFPESFKDKALNLWWVVLGGFALTAFLTWVERDAKRTPFDPTTYAKVLRTLREAYDGMLALVYFATVAGASLAGLFVFAGMRTHAHWMPQMSSSIRDLVLNAWWFVAFVPLVFIMGLLFACDVWLWAFGRSRTLSKTSLTRGFEPFEELLAHLQPQGEARLDRFEWWVALIVLGFFMLFAIPGANQLSPKEVFESYRQVCPGAPLALLGVGGRTAAYYAGGQPQTLSDTTGAYNWLVAAAAQPSGQRRCLAMKAEELPKLNQLWREHSPPETRTNLPIVDARSSQILLAASSFGPNDKDENPLSAIVLSAPPHPQRPIDANMDDKLNVIGIDLLDERGKLVDAIAPGKTYHMKTYYKVLGPVTTEWEGFIHIDGYHRRHNGDHKPMNGKYPMALWLPGDLLVDDHEFKLEPNFSPGTYTIFFGLFAGDTRLKVKSGPNDGDNRINGGPLKVQ
ncbi:MAG: hypothetical protein ABSE49_30340, partial [Polyangiaceae bacterium]